jgi:hypothetical protein
VFSRVNISYWEGRDFRTMLYKGEKEEEFGENHGFFSFSDFSLDELLAYSKQELTVESNTLPTNEPLRKSY